RGRESASKSQIPATECVGRAGGPGRAWYAGTSAGIGVGVKERKRICQQVADPGHEVRREVLAVR
ncbi:MAG TPA: hypothetical protein DET40_15235, partial [Lentisphaeria bacterium]|nr:hypothetical protein [Lentisphaeria bacterium]